MDRRTALAMILCIVIFMGWQKFVIEPRLHSNPPAEVATSTTPPQSSQQPQSTSESRIAPLGQTTVSKSSTPTRKPPQSLQVSNDIGQATLGDDGHIFLDWTLKNYKLDISKQAAAVDLQSVTHQPGELALAFDDPQLSYIPDAQGQLSASNSGATWNYEDSNIKFSREVTTHGQNPYFEVQLKAEFKGKAPKYAFLYLTSQSFDKDPEAQDRHLLYWTNNSAERILLKDSVEQKEIPTSLKYIAASNRYFIMAVVSETGFAPTGLIQPAGPQAGRISMVYPVNGNSITIPVRVYFGPKELNLLRQVEPTLDHTVDFGWFTIFAYPLLRVLKWFYQFVQNYGLAIIFLTLLLKVVTYPLTYKSMKSMKKMAKLQPQLQKIRERYKDDKEALNREMLTMMRSNGYNPMAGCLPMIIQMPIFFALYRVLYSSIELYHAPFALWIHDLSSHDPFYVTPILLSVTMFIQQKLTPNTATDPAQARMMQLMPLIFGAFMLALPSGLTIYMLVNALASIAQQMILNKKLDSAPA